MKDTGISSVRLSRIYLPLGLLVLNFVLKFLFLDSRSIAGDEPFSIYYAQLDIHSIISWLSKGNNPPLFEMILHYWIRVFGISPFSVRFLPFLFSVITVYFIYQTGLRYFNLRVALVSGLLFTFSNYHIGFSHEARVYSLFALLTAVSMYSWMNLVSGRSNVPDWTVLLLSNVLLVYSHFFGFFIPFLQLLFAVLFKEIRVKALKTGLISMGIVLFCYLPYLPVLLTRFKVSVSTGTWIDAASLEDLYSMLWRFSNTPVVTVIFIAIFLSSIIKWLAGGLKDAGFFSKVVITWFLFPFLLMFLVSMKYLPVNVPVFIGKYLVFTSIAYYLVLAIAIDYVLESLAFRRYLIWLPVILMACTCNPDVDNKRHVAEMMNKLKQIRTPGTPVYYCPGHFAFNFAYYYNREFFQDTDAGNYYGKINTDLMRELIFPLATGDEPDTGLLAKAGKIIYLDAGADQEYPGNHIFNTLKLHHPVIHVYEFPEFFRICEFAR